jgi:hypothetical protein
MADLRFNVSAETRAATAALGSFAQDIQKRLVTAVRALPDIELTADSTDAQREVKRLRDELAGLANRRIGVDISAEDALAETARIQTALRQLAGSTADVQVRADAGAAERALGDIEAEVRALNGQRAEVEVTADTSQAEGEVSGLGSRLSGAAVTAGTAIGSALGDAAADLIGTAITQAVEASAANARLEAQLMGDPAALGAAGAAAGRLWADGYGSSLDEVNQSVFAAITSSAEMRNASVEDITAVAGAAMDLSEVWGVDVQQALRAAGQLVTNDLVPTTTAGLGLISQAYSDLGPAADDAIDTVVEYSTQFRGLGLDGPAAMSLLSQAVRGGARDTDTAADALKEFGLLARDETSTAAEGFRTLGLDAGAMADAIAEGGPRSVDALDQTLEALRRIEDPVLRNATAVQLFGTKAEDLQGALLAMDPTPAEVKFRNLEQTVTQTGDVMGQTVESNIQRVGRGLIGMATSAGDSEQLVTSVARAWQGAMGLLGIETAATMDAVGEDVAGASAELAGLSEQLAAVPPGRSITVDALTEPARLQLEELGFRVTELPDGRFEVIPDTAGALGALEAFVADASTRSATLTLDANADPATGKVAGVIDLGNGSMATVLLDANADPATGKIFGTVDLGNGQTAVIMLDGNPDPATGMINAVVTDGNGRVSTVQLAANPGGAYGQLGGFVDTGNRTTTTPTVAANTQPARSSVGAWLASIPSVITTVIRTVFGNAAGGVYAPMQHGGVLYAPDPTTRVLHDSTSGRTVATFAGGGLAEVDGHRLTPMPMQATAVPPNTWRVVGDRQRDVEVYLPLDGSRRTLAMTEYAAAEQGYDLIPRGRRGAQDPRTVLGMAQGGAIAEALAASRTPATARVAEILAAAPAAMAQARSSAGAVAVLDAAVRGEIAALRRDLATANLDAAQLAALNRIDAKLGTAGWSALGDADAGGRRADGGAW